MSGSDWVGVCWLVCGLIGGVGFAWSNRHLDQRHTDRAMTIAWSVGIGVMLGFFALLLLGEEDEEP
jgi:drug/metabolite transporter (DMT)-like permease